MVYWINFTYIQWFLKHAMNAEIRIKKYILWRPLVAKTQDSTNLAVLRGSLGLVV